MTILPLKKVIKEKESENRGNETPLSTNSHHHSHYNNIGQHQAENRNVPTRSRSVLSNTPPRTYDESPSTSIDIKSHADFNNQFSKRKFKKSPNRTNRKHKNPHANRSVIQNSSKLKNINNYDDVNEYNSGDEYEATSVSIDPEKLVEMEKIFQKNLQDKKGFQIKQMSEDGACLFRAVADQVYGDQEMHGVVRKHCMDYMSKNSDYFSQFVTENFDNYIARKCQDNSHGNHLEIQAMAEMYNRPMEVYEYGTEPINIFHGYNESGNEPIRLSYHKNSHYNSVINPHKATIGVGLGMPSFHPGLADKNLVIDAVQASEKFALEDTMLKDKLAATDWEATNKAIEEQVARESYLQWLRDMEKQQQQQPCEDHASRMVAELVHSQEQPAVDHTLLIGTNSDEYCGNGEILLPTPPRDSFVTMREHEDSSAASTSSISTSSSSTHNANTDLTLIQCHPNSETMARGNEELANKFSTIIVDPIGTGATEPKGGDNGIIVGELRVGKHTTDDSSLPSTSNKTEEFAYSDYLMDEEDTTSFLSELPPEVLGLSEWEDNKILAQVLAASQQEYLDQLKKSSHHVPS